MDLNYQTPAYWLGITEQNKIRLSRIEVEFGCASTPEEIVNLVRTKSAQAIQGFAGASADDSWIGKAEKGLNLAANDTLNYLNECADILVRHNALVRGYIDGIDCFFGQMIDSPEKTLLFNILITARERLEDICQMPRKEPEYLYGASLS